MYKVIGIAHHSEALEELVVYQTLYNSEEWGDQAIWVRLLENFVEEVEIDGKK